MLRYLVGAVSALLLVSGAFLVWQGRAEQPAITLPPPPMARTSGPVAFTLPEPPKADAKSREQKRFARADKDKDGRITLAELTQPRHKAFEKLDRNGDGRLSFEEWAVKTIDKFGGADANHDGGLTPVEFATTAPKPRAPKPECACG